MKRMLVRYSLALLCFSLAAYTFLRTPSPLWTVDVNHTTVLNFMPDGRSFWTYHSDEGKEKPVITFQKYETATGKVLAEHKAVLDIAGQGQFVELSSNGQVAYIKVPQVPHDGLFNTHDILVDLTTGLVKKLPNSGKTRYSLSPTGKWLNDNNGHGTALSIFDQDMQLMLALNRETSGDGESAPFNAFFNSDESLVAVVWNYNDGKGKFPHSQIRFYDTANWKEQSRLSIDKPGFCTLNDWQGNQVEFYLYLQPSGGMNEATFEYYSCPITTPLLTRTLSDAKLIASCFNRNYGDPYYTREYRLIFDQGIDWHVVRAFREKHQNEWIEWLRRRQYISTIIDRFWPREVSTLEFYQTSTSRLLNRMQIGSNTKYHISTDGQWIAGFLNEPGQLGVYSTAPLMRWPGYLFVVAGLVVLFWNTVSRILTDQRKSLLTSNRQPDTAGSA